LLNLQVEWGLTTEEFENESIEKIMKILEYRSAQAKGEEQKIKSQSKK
jgi:hypothetical protein